jgi:threonyl-tRNA synthetase
MQVDFNMAERLGAEYVAEDNSRRHPVMLHRAIVGSLERFIGILIEQHAGALPAWLAPVQVVVASITDAQADYARERGANRCKNKELEVSSICATRKSTIKSASIRCKRSRTSWS